MQIHEERRVADDKQNSLSTLNEFPHIDYDIRNSQLINSVQLEHKRLLEKSSKT